MLPGLLKPPGLMAPSGYKLPRMVMGGTTIATSEDAGASWTSRHTLPGGGAKVRSFAYSPTAIVAAGDINYVGRSTDGGQTWSNITISGVNAYTGWGVIYGDGRFILFGSFGSTVYIYYSTDDGATWSNSGVTLPTGISFIKPNSKYFHEGTFAFGSAGTNKMHVTTNGGLNWSAVTMSSVATEAAFLGTVGGVFLAAGRNVSAGRVDKSSAMTSGYSAGLTHTSSITGGGVVNDEFMLFAGGSPSTWRSTVDGVNVLASGSFTGVSNNPVAVAYRDGFWTVCFEGGTVRRNTTAGDRSAWTTVTTPASGAEAVIG